MKRVIVRLAASAALAVGLGLVFAGLSGCSESNEKGSGITSLPAGAQGSQPVSQEDYYRKQQAKGSPYGGGYPGGNKAKTSK